MSLGLGQAAVGAELDLSNKPVDVPTLDYLKDNNISIPQVKVDENGDFAPAASIESPGSIYSIESGTEEDHNFVYTSSDNDGNTTSSYYKLNLNNDKDGITWQFRKSPSSDYYDIEYTIDPDITTSQRLIHDENSPVIDINNEIFVGNRIDRGGEYGGAIYNTGAINNLSGYFIDNQASYTSGGAIYNAGTIKNITAHFIYNYASYGRGGAIYNTNTGTIENITGDFIRNYGSSGGVAIVNDGKIGNITGDFISNTSGTISNYESGTINKITGNFINNTSGNIYNAGTIRSIAGNFINNPSNIVNYGTIGSITGNFIGNTASYDSNELTNRGAIGSITGNFINNTGRAGSGVSNNGFIKSVSGNFIGNTSIFKNNGEDPNPYGGAIENSGTIGNITGKFINNTAIFADTFSGIFYDGFSLGYSSGGAIHSGGQMVVSDSLFKNNSSINDVLAVGGGVSIVTKILKEFSDISADIKKEYYSAAKIVNSEFLNNTAEAVKGKAIGGAIYHEDIYDMSDFDRFYSRMRSTNMLIEDSVFQNNKAESENDTALGGAIAIIRKNQQLSDCIVASSVYNAGPYLNDINAEVLDALRSDYKNDTIINTRFIDNYVIAKNGEAKGGAIYTEKDLDIIADNGVTEFTGNYVQGSDGAKENQAIYVANVPLSGEIVVNSIETGYIVDRPAESPVLNFSAVNNGKIIINDKIVGEIGDDNPIMTSAHATFDGELRCIDTSNPSYVTLSTDKTITDKLKFIEDGLDDSGINRDEYYYNYKYLGYNYTTQKYEYNVILLKYLDESEYTYEQQDEPAVTINFGGDQSGYIELNNNIEGINKDGSRGALNIGLSSSTLHFGVRDDVLDGNNLTLNSGTLSMVNSQAGISSLNKLTVAGNTNFVADVDLVNKEMDRFVAAEYGEHTGNINVIGMNLLNNIPEDRTDVTAIYFAEPGLKNNVTSGISGGKGDLPDSKYQLTALTPIYKYNVTYDNQNQYDNKGDGGYFLFAKSSSSNPSDSYNPAVLSAPVASTAAAQATMNEVFHYVFEHADAFTQFPLMDRVAKIDANKYALSTEYNNNLGSFNYEENNKGVWVRPYATFEKMSLHNGPKVDSINYGTIVGYDGDFKRGKNGWYRVGTGYLGYNGAQLDYSGVDTSMNGGTLGYTETWYKKNFWTALTVAAGASVGESRTMYGKEDFTSLMAGIGSKTGYNIEFKNGRYILSPIMFMSYTFVDTFNYTNAAGVSIKTKPAHSIQLNPNLRLVANYKNGWQPYAQVGMVWNVMNESSVRANNVKLPEMSMKPYVEYGLGVQRQWKDRFTAFGQAMVRNGGRNGIALTAGFRWALGSEGSAVKNPEKVSNPQPKVVQSPNRLNIMSKEELMAKVNGSTNTVGMKKIVKQLSGSQRMAMSCNQNKTTKTPHVAVIKKL